MRARDARSEGKPVRSPRRSHAGATGGKLASWPAAAVLGLQRSAGNAAVARMLSEERTSRPVQRFTVYNPGDENYPVTHEKKLIGSQPAKDSGEFFPSQHKDETGKFIGPTGKANIQYSKNPPLQISDNLDLAIENNVEAKYFYATADHIKKANKKLKGSVSFDKGAKLLVITLDGGKKRELFQVIPKVEEGGKTRKGLDATTAQQCNAMADQVTGMKGVQASLKGEEHIARILDVLDGTEEDGKWLGELKSKHRQGYAKTAKKADQEEYFFFIDAMVSEFLERSTEHPEALAEAIRSVRLNQHLEPPAVGDAMATQSVMTGEQIADRKRSGEQFFEYHFGGVVAVSGNDYVTMENYAREQGKAVSSGDPLFFFKMYGAERTWHDAQQATGSFFGAVLSMVLKRA